MRSPYASVCVVLYHYCHCYLGEIRAAIQGGEAAPVVLVDGRRIEWALLPCEE